MNAEPPHAEEEVDSQDDQLAKTLAWSLINVLLLLIILTLWLGAAVAIYAGLGLTVIAMVLIGIIATGRV